MYNRLNSYLAVNNIIISNQYGFRAKHSTYMAVLDFYDKVSKAIENKLVSVGVFIDLQKAFDSLNHDILISKLEHYGIRGITINLFRNYLTNRKQFVSYNGFDSVRKPINCGIPQGSILGPLLFLIYINDIINCSALLYFVLFADDTNLLVSGTSCQDVMNILNPELQKLALWFNVNKLSLNVAKTNYILFGSKRRFVPDSNFQIKINNCTISRVTNVKFLGLNIDENLTWSEHSKCLSVKLSRSIGVINRLKLKIKRCTLKILYTTLIQPYLQYCVMAWGCANATTLDRLEKLQKRAIRIISGASYLAHCNPLFRSTNILKIRDLYEQEVLTYMYRVKHNFLPSCCMRYVILTTRGNYNLRLNNDFVEEFVKSVVRSNSVSAVGPRLWNSLPLEVRACVSLRVFKNSIRKSLLDKYS